MTDTQGTDLLQQAIAALQGGIPGQARAILESLTAQGADTAAVWGVLALACRDQEDMPAALEAAERSLAHEARNPRALVVKGDAYYKLGDRQASAAFYREALTLLPARPSWLLIWPRKWIGPEPGSKRLLMTLPTILAGASGA